MSISRRTSVLAATAFLFFCGCATDRLVLGPPEPIDSPAAPGSLAPNLAVGLDGNLYLSWIESVGDAHALRFSTWSGGGWSAPRTVAEGERWFVNWADFPSMAALEDGTLAAHWLVRSDGGTYAYDVMLSLSRDGGASWSEPFSPHRDDTQTEHGFVSLIPDPAGRFGVVWLDGRNMVGPTPGPMSLRYATLLPDGVLQAESRIDERVCDCCSTDAVLTGDGGTLVAYRDRTDSEVRDISISSLTGATWSSPRTVHADNWKIAACPVNGPVVDGRGDLLAVAWFTGAEGAKLVQVAFSVDGGQSFDRPLRVDHGDPLGRVDLLLLDDGSALVSWLERNDERARVYVRHVRPSGALESTLVTTTSAARASGFPRMARVGTRIVLAWTEAGEPSRIRTTVLSM